MLIHDHSDEYLSSYKYDLLDSQDYVIASPALQQQQQQIRGSTILPLQIPLLESPIIAPIIPPVVGVSDLDHSHHSHSRSHTHSHSHSHSHHSHSHPINQVIYLQSYNNLAAPRQFSPNMWIGNVGILSNSAFFANNSIKFIISCISTTSITKHFLKNRHFDFTPPEYCVLVVDPSFKSSAASTPSSSFSSSSSTSQKNVSQVLKFISKYNSILSAVINSSKYSDSSTATLNGASDITSPVITIKDKLSLVENLVNLIQTIRQNFPQTGILILDDNETESHKRRALLLAIAYIININPNLTTLDALILLKNYKSVDDVFINNENFFSVLEQYRLNVTANKRFYYNRNQNETLKRNFSNSFATDNGGGNGNSNNGSFQKRKSKRSYD